MARGALRALIGVSERVVGSFCLSSGRVALRTRHLNSEGRRTPPSTAPRSTNSTAHMDHRTTPMPGLPCQFQGHQTLGAGMAADRLRATPLGQSRSSRSSRPPPTRRTRGGRARRRVVSVAALRQLVHPNIIRLFGSWLPGAEHPDGYANGGSLQHEIVGPARGRSGTTRTSSSITSCRWCRRSRWCTPPASSTATSSRQRRLHVGRAQGVDFGIAKVLGDSATCAQTCVGSPYYMSLEQMKGSTSSTPTRGRSGSCSMTDGPRSRSMPQTRTCSTRS